MSVWELYGYQTLLSEEEAYDYDEDVKLSDSFLYTLYSMLLKEELHWLTVQSCTEVLRLQKQICNVM